jgi:pimeloyl-ACP methyl ester carboxylesterase
MKTRSDTCVHLIEVGLVILICLIVATCHCLPASAQPIQTPPAQSSAATNQAITGDWEAALGRQHLGLKIEPAEGGALKATLTLKDQNNLALPFDSAVLAGDGTLQLVLKQLGSTYSGQLSADKSTIAGTWKQGGAAIALTFRRPGTVQAFTLQPRKQGQVALQPCRTPDGNLEGLCGTYEVFENRAIRSGRKIALNLMLLPAATAKPEPDPFFAIAGGPGQGTVEPYPAIGFVTRVRLSRDVILVDQRGTGKSNLLQCTLQSPSDVQAMIGEHYTTEAIRRCREESDKKADTTQYTTSIAMDDLDEVRQALGYEKINVVGDSYGTYAGLVYLRRHGDHVRTITLIAVAAPSSHIVTKFAHGIQDSIGGIIAACEADAACHAGYPDLGPEFNAVLDRLGKAPAEFTLKGQKVTLSREMFLGRLRTMLYVPQIISLFPLTIHNAYNNDWALYGNLVVELRGGIEPGIARGMFFSVICAEDIPGLTEAIIKRDTAGTWMGDSPVRRYQSYCRDWGTVGAVPKDFYAPVRSNVPALLISGALDPGTPPDAAREVAHELPNGRLLLLKQGTHGTGSECVDGLIADFVQQGSVAKLDASCIDQIHLPAFVPNPAAKPSSGEKK